LISISELPALNATLNGVSAVLLAGGYVAILNRRILLHKICMVSAFLTSTIFLISYLTYHAHVGSVRFNHFGWIRPVYFSVLFTHTILAALIVPLVLVTLSRALQEKFERHKKIARWTLPLWFYVSVTGVVIYWMLYRM
jgi:putative membrane protein